MGTRRKRNKNKTFLNTYETKTLSDRLNKGLLERWVPGFSADWTEEEHVNRYMWVSEFVKGKTVLDIACGTGKGCLIMQEYGQASQVLGIDNNKKTIKYASIKYPGKRITYRVGDAENFKSDGGKDIVVSFETIEHLKHPDKFFKLIQKILKPNGTLFISTPISEASINKHPSNRFHYQEWSLQSFSSLISKFFRIGQIYIQATENTTESKNIVSRIFKDTEKVPLLIPVRIEDFKASPEQIGTRIQGYQIFECHIYEN